MNFENNVGAIQPFEGMNQIIKTTQSDEGEILISGRELHEFLEVKTNYSTWFDRMTEYGFEENIDYVLLSNFEKQTGSGGHNKLNHHLKMDMAKEVAMIQRNEKGKEARQYFLQIEKMWNSPEMIMKRAMDIANMKVLKLTQQTQQLQETIEEQRPKVLFSEAVSASETSILVNDLAKLLKQNGYECGGTRLYKQLREEGYLIKRKGSDYNSPTQRSMELGLFEITETVISRSNGNVKIVKTPKVTGKGQIYFMKRYLKH